MKPDVFLFDLDGTLTDPKRGIVGSIRFALDRLEVVCPADDMLTEYIGPPLRATFAKLLSTSDQHRIEEAMALYRERFASTGLFENYIYDGIRPMLEQAGHVARAMYVATSKPAVYAERIVNHFNLAEHFRKIYGPQLDGRYEEKAELVAYLLATEQMAPEMTVMIGDRAADIRAASANGLRSIGVLWGYGSEEELVDAGAGIVCRTPQDLVSHLSGP